MMPGEGERWEVERDRHGVMFSGPLEVGEMIEVVPASRLEAAESRAMEWAKVADDARKAKMLAESELAKVLETARRQTQARQEAGADLIEARAALTEALDAIEEWREQRGRATVQSDDEANDLWLVAVANRIRSQIEGSNEDEPLRGDPTVEVGPRSRRSLIEGSNE